MHWNYVESASPPPLLHLTRLYQLWKCLFWSSLGADHYIWNCAMEAIDEHCHTSSVHTMAFTVTLELVRTARRCGPYYIWGNLHKVRSRYLPHGILIRPSESFLNSHRQVRKYGPHLTPYHKRVILYIAGNLKVRVKLAEFSWQDLTYFGPDL